MKISNTTIRPVSRYVLGVQFCISKMFLFPGPIVGLPRKTHSQDTRMQKSLRSTLLCNRPKGRGEVSVLEASSTCIF